MALPAFHLVRRKFGDARIVALTNKPIHPKAPSVLSVLGGSGLIDDEIIYPVGMRGIRNIARLREEIRNGKFSMAINLTAPRSLLKSIRDEVFLRSCNIPSIIGTPWRRRDLVLARKKDSEIYEWEAERLVRRIEKFGEANLDEQRSWDLKLSKEEHIDGSRLLLDAGISGGFYAFSIGTKSNTNDWTQEKWIELIDLLAKQDKEAQLVGIGADSDFVRTEECLQRWKGRRANFCGRASVRVIASILQQSSIFIGHDSGPMHLAAVVNVPCVAVFSGRNPPGQWFPRGANNTIIYRGSLNAI